MPGLREALMFLLATVIAVPISKRLGLGTVLGYIAAGMVIGPWGLAAVGDVDQILHFAELGVALLLFVIGLELQPARLWQMRRMVFVLGTAQMVVSTIAIGGAGLASGLDWRASLVIGFGLSLSSTAFALQLLGERKDLATPYGQGAFGVLLLQDVAVIPMLAILPMLSGGMRENKFSWLGIVDVIAMVVCLVLAERFVIRRLFRFVANTRSQDVFTATTLLIALGTAALVNYVGMSMALGAFLAGALLANSEYRHELEADIEPFKGLLLGLFFIAVGMSVNLGLVWDRPLAVFGLVLGLILIKSLILYGIGELKFRNGDHAVRLALAISQGGEFAFVLFGLAVGRDLITRQVADLLVAVVTLSMAATPALFVLYDKVLRRLFAKVDARDFDVAPQTDPQVIIAGFGRVGQVVGRVLRAKRIPFTALDSSPEHIDFVKRFGNKVFYGDASRLDLLRAALADKASVLVLAIDDPDTSVRAAQTALQNFPNLKIIARARNRQHVYQLLNLGVTHVFRETFESSLSLTQDVLESLGFSREDAKIDIERFQTHDEQMVLQSYKFHDDEKKLVAMANQARAELESIFEGDIAEQRNAAE